MNFQSLPYDALGLLAGWAFLVLMTLTGLLTPVLASFNQLAGAAATTAFRDKLARQLGGMGLTLLLAVTLPSFGVQAYYYFLDPKFLPQGVLPFGVLAWSLMLLAVVAASLFLIFFRALRKAKAARKTLGALAALSALAALHVVTSLKFQALVDFDLLTTDPWTAVLPTLLAPPADSLYWPILALLLLTGLTGAAGLGLVYLLIRRNKDDFGRDYYTFCLKRSASQALALALLQLATLGWLLWKLGPDFGPWSAQNTLVLGFGLAGICLVLGMALWGLTAASKTPLRQKPSIIAAAILLILAIFFEAAPFFLDLVQRGFIAAS